MISLTYIEVSSIYLPISPPFLTFLLSLVDVQWIPSIFFLQFHVNYPLLLVSCWIISNSSRISMLSTSSDSQYSHLSTISSPNGSFASYMRILEFCIHIVALKLHSLITFLSPLKSSNDLQWRRLAQDKRQNFHNNRRY